MRETIGGLDDKTYGLSPIEKDFKYITMLKLSLEKIPYENLNKVKLVLGNGFDLHCCLKSSYYDFFINNKEAYEKMYSFAELFHNREDEFEKVNLSKTEWEEFDNCYEGYSFWDVEFYFYTYIKEYYRKDKKTNSSKGQVQWEWCEIEKIIAEMVSYNLKTSSHQRTTPDFNSLGYLTSHFLLNFLLHRYPDRELTNEKVFNMTLLEELNIFERRFGEYIHNLTSKEKDEKAYYINALRTINVLCDIDNLVSIDTFNYDEPRIPDFNIKFNHINGDWKHPIFGINSSTFLKDDPKYIFTKEYRRQKSNITFDSLNEGKEFKNIVFYGHSLDEADYDYFFYLFDKINISDMSNDSKLVFAYSNFNNDTHGLEYIKNNLNVYKLLSAYSIQKKLSKDPLALANRLGEQNRISFYLIDNA